MSFVLTPYGPPNTQELCAGFGWGGLGDGALLPKHPERGPAQGLPGLSLEPWEGKWLNHEECRSQG